jgi:hypothetical protein
MGTAEIFSGGLTDTSGTQSSVKGGVYEGIGEATSLGDAFAPGFLETPDPSGAILGAAEIAAQSQREALEYQKEREYLYQIFREGALEKLGGLYGLEGGTGDQEAMIQAAKESPLYQSLIGGAEAGEEAIMRNAAMTGGLRSGGTQAAMYDYNTQLQNTALLESYNQQLQGLTGMAGLPSNVNAIASGISGIGATTAQGITAATQAQAMAQQQTQQNMMSAGGMALGAVAAFSDRRLKKNLKKIGEINGFNWYSFDWNGVGEIIGLNGSCQGIMADEVFDKMPEAVSLRNNFMFVNYSMLGVFEEAK